MKRIGLFLLAWVVFAIGMIGVILPILPTTPFILLAAFLFAKSSKKWETWIKNKKVYKKYVLSYKKNNGLTIKQKAEILTSAYLLLFISGCLMNHIHIRLFLIALAIVKFIILWRVIPSIQVKEVTE
ncbi:MULTISPECIES: YbaN family protein [Bacillus]|uniref:YbaN family protein n=1 Tax=Bacillus TaxID=1386 RepID=UPI0002FE993F|nr:MULTISPECIES: YbaN family protein [Bacillus]